MPRRTKTLPTNRTLPFHHLPLLLQAADFASPEVYDLFVPCLEEMRRRFSMCVYGYVVMLEHVPLLVSEPERRLAGAIHDLKLAFAKRLRSWEGDSLTLNPIAEARQRIIDYCWLSEYKSCCPLGRA